MHIYIVMLRIDYASFRAEFRYEIDSSTVDEAKANARAEELNKERGKYATVEESWLTGLPEDE